MNVYFAYTTIFTDFVWGECAPPKGNPVLCQPVFDSRQRRVDLMRGSVCFYLPCKDARALCQSVVGFTPATCCQKKRPHVLLMHLDLETSLMLFCFFCFLRGSISCQFIIGYVD